jgi:hypothetical protein
MVSAVSSAVSAVLAGIPPAVANRPAGRVRWFFKVPDLSDEAAAAISKANSWPTFIGICRAIHDRGRRGTEAERNAADDGVIGIGIKALARSAGLDPVTVRRQIRKLEGLGLVVVVTRGITAVADPVTGRITANRIGRTPAALVYLTVTEAHMRPAAAKAAAKAGGAKRTPSGRADRVQSAPPSKERTKEKRETPSAPPQDAGLPAGKAGGHPAAEASQEGRQGDPDVHRQDDPGLGATPVPPASAGSPEPSGEERPVADHAAPPERSGRPPVATPASSVPSAWATLAAKGAAENSSPPDGSGMRGGSFLAEYRRACGLSADEAAIDTIEQDRDADELRKALDDLPDESRRRAGELGRRAIEDTEAEAVQRLLDDQRRRAIEERRVEAAARKESARAAYRRQKAAEAAA